MSTTSYNPNEGNIPPAEYAADRVSGTRNLSSAAGAHIEQGSNRNPRAESKP